MTTAPLKPSPDNQPAAPQIASSIPSSPTTLSIPSSILSPYDVPPIDITTRTWKADPFPEYARLRHEQPICRVRFGRFDAWMITRYDDVLAVLKDDARFIKNRRAVQSEEQSKEQGWAPAFLRPLEKNLLYIDNPDHGRLRGLVHKAFTPQRIEHMQGRVESIAMQLLHDMRARIAAKGSADLVHDFALPLPLIVIADLLGIPNEDRAKFNRWTKPLLKPPTTANKFAMLPAIWFFLRYLREIFAIRRADPRDDLLTALLQAEEEGDKMSEDELIAMVFLLLVAGHETTVNLIASGAFSLLSEESNPSTDQFELLRQDPSLIRSAVEELLRYVNPVETATDRFVAEDLVLSGVEMKRGERVLAALASANRDESAFADAEHVDITRQKNKHLAFGMGAHYCVGAPLARMEGAIAINLLAQEMPTLRLAVPAKDVRWRDTQFVRGVEKLPVRL
jgi:cytochrome P450 PksS